MLSCKVATPLNTTQYISTIKKELPIAQLVGHYTQLKPKRSNLTGVCPFCRSAKGFNVSTGKNIFKCFACGQGGDPINFILKYEKMNFKEAVEFLVTKFCNTLNIPENFTDNPIRGDVYVLSLNDSCYYVGFTRYFDLRMKDHFDGRGAIWTRKHPPIEILEINPNKTLNYENFLTEKYIELYGYDRVRGGDHIFFNKKYGI